MSVEEMVKGCLDDNPLAQAELYATFSPKMLPVCYRYAMSKEDAEDMLQEGFIRIFTQIQSFENKGSFEGWVRRIIVNTCINFLKKNKKFSDQTELNAAFGVEVEGFSITALMQNKQVIDCIRMLPLGYRTVLNLYAIEGYTHKEIAFMLDINEGTSRSQYSKAKNLLEQILITEKIVEKSSATNTIVLI